MRLSSSLPLLLFLIAFPFASPVASSEHPCGTPLGGAENRSKYYLCLKILPNCEKVSQSFKGYCTLFADGVAIQSEYVP